MWHRDLRDVNNILTCFHSFGAVKPLLLSMAQHMVDASGLGNMAGLALEGFRSGLRSLPRREDSFNVADPDRRVKGHWGMQTPQLHTLDR